MLPTSPIVERHEPPATLGLKALGLALCFGSVGLAVALGSLFMPDAWFRELVKPSFNPPDWIFGPVWTCLYGLMAVAAWLVWLRADSRRRRIALGLFGFQLLLNAVWTMLFFGAHRIGWALADIGLLWLAIVATTIAFVRIRPAAGMLLLPYLCWVTFAAVLNFAFWRLNG